MSKSEFKPAWWLPGPHLQTLWPTFCRRPIKNIPLEHERFELPDGDFLDLAWVGKEKKGPLVLILHGLEGSLHSPYAQGMLHAVHQRNWRGVLMHFRGCSGEPNRLPRSYHSGETKDLGILVNSLHERESNTPMAAVGFSLGGNVLLKWLGETAGQNPLQAAAAISVPFELHNSANRIQQGFSRLYQRYFLKCLGRRLTHKFQNQTAPITLPAFSELKSMWEFDDKVTAPLHGFSSVQEYYSLSSSRQYLGSINVPTLLVQSKDDPFMTPDIIPEQHELPECVKLEVTEAGGHVGFVAGRVPWRVRYWLEERVPTFLQEFFKNN
jgi:predicted alpha/beta-fold hydrolase